MIENEQLYEEEKGLYHVNWDLFRKKMLFGILYSSGIFDLYSLAFLWTPKLPTIGDQELWETDTHYIVYGVCL